MAQEGLITPEQAVLKVSPEHLEQLLHPMINYERVKAENNLDNITLNPGKVGVPASPGAGVGCGRIDYTLELPHRDSRMEDRAGPGLRKHGRVQASRPCAGYCLGAGGNHPTGRRAGGCVQSCHGAGLGDRRRIVGSS